MIAIVSERLETDRLIYERLGSEHAGDLIRLMLDPRVFATLWPPPHPPAEEDVRAGLDDKPAHWERHGFGMWALRDRATGGFVGRGGLQYTNLNGGAGVEVGWAIVPERWGEGLATELALVSVRVAFAVLELSELIAFSLPDNLASRRVIDKAGFAYDRELLHVGLRHVLYRRGRESAEIGGAPCAKGRPN